MQNGLLHHSQFLRTLLGIFEHEFHRGCSEPAMGCPCHSPQVHGYKVVRFPGTEPVFLLEPSFGPLWKRGSSSVQASLSLGSFQHILGFLRPLFWEGLLHLRPGVGVALYIDAGSAGLRVPIWCLSRPLSLWSLLVLRTHQPPLLSLAVTLPPFYP